MVNTERHFRRLLLRVGLRVHLVISEAGEPVECSLAAGSEADIKVFENLNTDLPEGSTMLADKGYPDYDHETCSERPAPRQETVLPGPEAVARVGGGVVRADRRL